MVYVTKKKSLYYTHTMNKKVLIGVIGANGSGKSTICEYLRGKKFHALSLSDIIREYIAEHNFKEDRDSLTHYSNFLKEQYGYDYFAKRTYEKTQNSDGNHIIFDSIRHPKEIEFLKSKGVRMVGVVTQSDNRYARIRSRKRGTDFVDKQTFERQDQRERSGQSKGQSIDECLTLCEHMFHNDGTLEELYLQIDNFLSELI